MKQQISINANRNTATPNPKMWGVFYEEINHAGDGGLYAEQIRNRNFADSNLPEETVFSDGKIQTKNGHREDFSIQDQLPGWKIYNSYGAQAFIKKIIASPRNENTPEQMKLCVYEVGNGVKLINSGFWGITVDEIGYHGFIVVRSKAINNITIGLMHKSGVSITSTEINDITDEFQKIEFQLDGIAVKDARFFIEVAQAGELYIDFVSLFPNNTYKRRQYGLRKDIMEILCELKPGFLRFPGGCVVEGMNLKNAIHWKDTIGPIEDRHGHWDLWGYRHTDGLGMLEYLQLCEDLDADIMYVCNCGMSCQARSSEFANKDELQQWLQDSLDAIEYIVGQPTTTWGTIRAKNGHPDPFKLRYVEIGNENSGEEYFHRYRIFYNAIKEKYPNLELISNCNVPSAPNDIIDDHYYTLPQYMPQIFDKYETYDKVGVKYYIGEYACNQEVGYGNLLSAISEACFMIGMERSADVVRIASYAPLFCNENDRKWPVNLINFDKNTVYGIPSYYLQKLFAENNPERVVETICNRTYGNSDLFATAGIMDNEMIIKIACFGSEDIAADICINNVNLADEGLEIILAGESEKDTNSVISPYEIVPAQRNIAIKDNKISHTFKACSFTIIKCKIRG